MIKRFFPKWYWAFHPDTMIHHDTSCPNFLQLLADVILFRRLRRVPPFHRKEIR